MPIVRTHIPKVETLNPDVLMDNLILQYLSVRIKHA